MTTRRAVPFEGDQAGSVTLFGVVAGLALLVLVGLVVDGGAKVRAVQRADAIAAEAARAGDRRSCCPPQSRASHPESTPPRRLPRPTPSSDGAASPEPSP